LQLNVSKVNGGVDGGIKLETGKFGNLSIGIFARDRMLINFFQLSRGFLSSALIESVLCPIHTPNGTRLELQDECSGIVLGCQSSHS